MKMGTRKVPQWWRRDRSCTTFLWSLSKWLLCLPWNSKNREGTADQLQSLAGVKPAVSPPVLCLHRSGQQLTAQIEDCIWCAKIRFLERCLALALCCPVKAMITCCFWRTSRKLGQTDAFKSSSDPAVRGSERGYINNSFPWTLLWVIERPTGWFMMSWTLMRQGCIWLWPGGELLFAFLCDGGNSSSTSVLSAWQGCTTKCFGWDADQQLVIGTALTEGSSCSHLNPPAVCLLSLRPNLKLPKPLFVRPTTGQ